MSTGHDWQPVRRRSVQRRCTKCGLWETALSRERPCGEPWPDDPKDGTDG